MDVLKIDGGPFFNKENGRQEKLCTCKDKVEVVRESVSFS